MNATPSPWTRPALLAQVLRRRRDGKCEVALRIAALAEPRGALRVEQLLHATAGVSAMSFDVLARRARVVFDDARLPLAELVSACAGVACVAEPLHRDALDDASRATLHASLKRLLVAGLFAMQAMMFASVLYFGLVDPLDATTARLFRWLGLLSAIPVVGYAASAFYRDALRGLRAGRPGIDVPVALAIVLIFGASVANAVRGSGEVYFDSISMFVFVLLLGRHLELRASLRHRAQGDAASDAMPLLAQRRRDDGALETVAANELEAGDGVHVAEGSAVPCDGVLTSARARVDAACWTGESQPQALQCGDAVAAGSISLDGPLDLRVERALAASSLAQLGRLTESARHPRERAGAPAQAAATRFVWRVAALAVATAAWWLWRDPARAFDATVAVLVVACPCAFGLAAPAVLTRTLAVLARRGALVVWPAALAALARVDLALFDKTGTLTEPAVDRGDVTLFRGVARHDAERWLVALARESAHPVARAAARIAVAGAPQASDVEVLAGVGVRGVVEGRALQLGRSAAGDDDALWLTDADGPLACWPSNESLRADAAGCVRALRADGVECTIVSGDAPSRVRAVAARLDISHWHARQSPADKLRQVRDARAQGRVVLVVGDGGNDAAALAAADASATPGAAVELARSQADLLLPGGLAGLPLARALATQAERILAQNRRGSLAWNLGAVPFAALGLVPPWLAAIGMSVSSLAVVLNSLRVREAPVAAPAAPDLRERTA